MKSTLKFLFPMTKTRHSAPGSEAPKDGLDHWVASSAALAEMFAGTSPEARKVFEDMATGLRTVLISEFGTSIDIDDVIGQTFFKALRDLQKTKKDADKIENFRGWIFKIAFNLALDAKRLCWNRKAVEFSDLSNEEFHAQRPDPAARLIAEEARNHDEKLKRMYLIAERQMSDVDREILHLYLSEGRLLSDIAQHSGISLHTIKTRYRQARIRLEKLMRDSAPYIDYEIGIEEEQKIDTGFTLPRRQNISTQNLNNSTISISGHTP